MINRESGMTINKPDRLEDILAKERQERERFEAEYKSLVDLAPDGIVKVNWKGFITFSNTAFSTITGYPPEEIVGKHFTQLPTLRHANIAQTLKVFSSVLKGKILSQFIFEWVDKDGNIRYGESNAAMTKLHGRPTGIIAVLRDVTERQKAEVSLKRQKELIDRILETIPSAVAVIDNTYKIVFANRAFRNAFNRMGVKSSTPLELIEMKELVQVISDARYNNISDIKYELKYNIDGIERSFIVNALLMQQDEILLFLNDITDERRRQESLYFADRLASVGKMAAGVAHELNNPLTSVIGLSQLLLEEGLPESLNTDVEAICKEAQRASQTVKNLLSFARKHESSKQSTPIEDVIHDVINLRAHEHKINNIIVKEEIKDDIPNIMVDYFQIQQVFFNIVINAEQAMIEARGKGNLLITAEKIKDIVKISFTDDGPGIRPENIKRIFDPFFTTKSEGRGTGLGLSICYGIVTAHGGNIYAESEIGKGATFIIELPIEPEITN
jgi:two-component system, NtrC family, sensor kinase